MLNKQKYTTLYLKKLGIFLVNPYKFWNPDNTPMIAYKGTERLPDYDGYYPNHYLFMVVESPVLKPKAA